MNHYYWFKTLHIIFVISWMAAMLYLPRIYVYHSDSNNKAAHQVFLLMEYRLIKFIMTPAMILTLIFGLLMAYSYGFDCLGIWFWLKMIFVLFLCGLHGFFIKVHKNFKKHSNYRSPRFFKIINEFVTICMIMCVVMIVIKPFE